MTYDPSTNLEFDARDVDCESKNPQPAFEVKTSSGGGWRVITYRDYNGDYNPVDVNGEDVTIEDYDPKLSDNTDKTVQPYQRCDVDCNPV